jgi:hypothetical protein
MRHTIFIFFFFLICSTAFSQSDSIKVEQYCQLIVTPRLFSNKVTVDIDFGEEKSFWRDERIQTYDGKIRKFNTIIDALNFMGKQGWIFINTYPVEGGGTVIYHYAFKKDFYISAI